MYEPRIYRDRIPEDGLCSFRVMMGESDLWIRADEDLSSEALSALREARRQIAGYIRRDPAFLKSLIPHPVQEDAPPLVRKMAEAGEKAGVGPMAAVAGAIAEYVGGRLSRLSGEVIVENGGDVFLSIARPRKVGIWAGNSSLSGKVALEVTPEETPLAVCTSSGTVGHSLSFGKADAAVAMAESGPLADAVATALGNRVQKPEDIRRGMEWAMGIKGVRGVLVIVGDRMGALGIVRLARA
ncbi:MAG TPA: UPF0280 family protein [Candidatus Latescibacteria bacterium]|nr:UPF0280 family protein [Candidatus Latescibacterota bacterium]